jgi:peptidoglycan/xylan/chitin deacetylase (PgdA/CDA1 family)
LVELLSKSHPILKLSEAWRRLQASSLDRITFSLTFDDGHRSVSEYVVPVLSRMRIPATLFVNTAPIFERKFDWFSVIVRSWPCDGASWMRDGREMARLHYLLRNTRDPVVYEQLRREIELRHDGSEDLARLFVEESFLQELDTELFEVGPHGHEHQRFCLMSPDAQRENLEKCLGYLRSLPAFVPIFAVPFGRQTDVDSSTFTVASMMGVTLAMHNGGVNVARAQEWIQRVPCDGARLRSHLRSQFWKSKVCS